MSGFCFKNAFHLFWYQLLRLQSYSLYLLFSCSQAFSTCLWQINAVISSRGNIWTTTESAVLNQPTEWDPKLLHTLSYWEFANKDEKKKEKEPTILENNYDHNLSWETWWCSQRSTKLWKLSPGISRWLCNPIEVLPGPKACSHFTAVGAVTALSKRFSGPPRLQQFHCCFLKSSNFHRIDQ